MRDTVEEGADVEEPQSARARKRSYPGRQSMQGSPPRVPEHAGEPPRVPEHAREPSQGARACTRATPRAAEHA